MPKVALVGTGLVGTSWGIVFARAGYDVALFDPVDGAAAASKGNVAKSLPDLAARGLLNGQTVQQRPWNRRSPKPPMCKRARRSGSR
jgi:3-hydroxyacyl-CoA dehydrogenase